MVQSDRSGQVGTSRFEVGDAITGFVPSDRDLLAGGAGDGVGVEVDVEVGFAVTPAGSGRWLGLAAVVDTGSGQMVQELPAAIRGVPIDPRAVLAAPAALTASRPVGPPGGGPGSPGDLGGGLASSPPLGLAGAFVDAGQLRSGSRLACPAVADSGISASGPSSPPLPSSRSPPVRSSIRSAATAASPALAAHTSVSVMISESGSMAI